MNTNYENKQQKSKNGRLIWVTIISFMFIVAVFINAVQHSKESNTTPKIAVTQNAPTKEPVRPTITQEPTATPTAKDFFEALGNKVAGDNSNVTITINKDGYYDIFNNIQLKPEVNLGFDVYTKKWITEFISRSYLSDFPVRYVYVSVAFIGTGRPTTIVGLGRNQADQINKETWKGITPLDLCRWLQSVETSRNDDNPANSTFIKNFPCK